MAKEISAISAFTIPCEGASNNNKIAPLKNNPANPSITVFSNGTRDVGCPYLDPLKGKCLAATDILSCIQLFPRRGDKSEARTFGLTPGQRSVNFLLTGSPDKRSPIPFNASMIEKKRKELDLSPNSFGELTGISRTQVLNIERGKRIGFRGSVYAAVKIAEFFQVPVEEILVNPEDAQRVIDHYEKMKEKQAKISAAAS